MKKSLVLGAAALATLLMAAPQDSKAGEIKVGGYYMFRMQDTDRTVNQDANNVDTERFWAQRLVLNADFIADKTTHAHLVTRVLDSRTVQGAESTLGGTPVGGGANTGSSTLGIGDWTIRKAWLETDAWGVGVKVGNMPLALNDNILVSNDDTGFGAVISPRLLAGLTTTQVQVLTTTQVAAVSMTDVANLSTAQMNVLTATQIGALNAAGLTSLEIDALSPTQMAGLTGTQLAVRPRRRRVA